MLLGIAGKGITFVTACEFVFCRVGLEAAASGNPVPYFLKAHSCWERLEETAGLEETVAPSLPGTHISPDYTITDAHARRIADHSDTMKMG